MIPAYDLSTEEGRIGFEDFVARLRATVSAQSAEAHTVAKVIAQVRERGDEAVVHFMRQWCDPAFDAGRIRVTTPELEQARDDLRPALRGALETAIANVRQYQEHLLPSDPSPIHVGGAEAGMRFTPMQRVGLAVPGGRASYPSTVIMLAVPALAAGVPAEGISVVTPPPTTRADGEPAQDVCPLVLAVCDILGIENVYRIGGAQAIAALALGTGIVRPVDMIAGPGNVFVQLAKQQLAGTVGIDGFYGPSEILTIADRSADPRRVAADLLAQAEHGPGRCVLVAWDPEAIDDVIDQIGEQLERRERRALIEKALDQESAVLRVADEDEAVAVADQVAAEHVSLAVEDPDALMARIQCAGEFFLGDETPVAAGDYLAGPSHCLPTGTTARFASGVSVYTFLKRSGWVAYRERLPAEAIDEIAILAEAEGLDGHAASARARRESS